MFGASQLTDDIIISAAKKGSEKDISNVIKTLEPQIRIMVTARISYTPENYHLTEDITQQTLIAITDGISRLANKTVLGLKAYTSAIVNHKVADALKGNDKLYYSPKQKLRSLESTINAFSAAGHLSQFLSQTGPSPRTIIEQNEQTNKLLTELGRLLPDHRTIITYAFFDQLPMQKIAQLMNISRPAGSMLLIRAIKTLRRNLTGSSQVGY